MAYVILSGSRRRVVPVAGGDAVDLGPLGEGGYTWLRGIVGPPRLGVSEAVDRQQMNLVQREWTREPDPAQ